MLVRFLPICSIFVSSILLYILQKNQRCSECSSREPKHNFFGITHSDPPEAPDPGYPRSAARRVHPMSVDQHGILQSNPPFFKRTPEKNMYLKTQMLVVYVVMNFIPRVSP